MGYLITFNALLLLIVWKTTSIPVPDDEFESEPNLRSGSVINSWNESWEVNPDELGNYFQGDIITTTTDLRSIAKNESLRWPSGVVPYVVAGPFNDEGMKLLEWAMNQYHQHTCVRFKPKGPDDHDYLYITNAFTGCWSSLGRQGGKQDLNLQHPGCLNSKRKGTGIHELMHALGIKHEHTRVDRDKYVTVMKENISPARGINFEKSTEEEATNYGIPYDFGSVMHYSTFAFSTDFGKKPTLQPNLPEQLLRADGKTIKMGQRKGFGVNDIKKLNLMYCPQATSSVIEPGPVVSFKKESEGVTSSAADWWSKVITSLQETFD